MFDVILRHGTIIDGTRAPRFQADVGIRGDSIAEIGDLSQATAAHTIDARGLVVAPGFVDVHNHSDGWLLRKPHFTPKTVQGFTSEVIMADGISYAPVRQDNALQWIYYLRTLNALRIDEYLGWESLADYMDLLDGHTAQNVATHIPYANLRVNACGWGDRRVDDLQMRNIKYMVRQGMEAGAVGLSTGLDYISQCYATKDELVAACSAMADSQGLYVTHIRYKLGNMPAIQEAVEIGKQAGVPVHISHLKAPSPREAEEELEYIDKVARHEVDFSFDVYPYQPGCTMLNYLLPYEVWSDGPAGVIPKLLDPEIRARFAASLDAYRLNLDKIQIAWMHGKENSRHQGRLILDYIQETGLPPADALANLLIEEGLAVLLVFIEGDDPFVEPFLKHDLFMLGTDGIYFEDGVIHPRMHGSAARILGPLVRDLKLFTLEEAVYKISAAGAKRFGFTRRGTLQTGNFADIALFDPLTIADRATYANPHQKSVGMQHVLVNGVPVVREGEPVDLPPNMPGRWLKYQPR